MAAKLAEDTTTHAPAARDERVTPRLALAPARGQELTGPLGELAKLYLLDVNSTSLLTRRAAMEMKLIAVMLTINFFFDLAVWTSLWNMVFYEGKLTLGLFSIVSLFCGFLFAAIIFVYERQFMTADTYHRWRKVWWPVTIRLCIIIIAAAITTQPFEVMVFSGPIERRLHEESVRVEAMSRLRALEDASLKTQGAIGLKNTVAGKSLEDAQRESQKAREQTSTFKAEARAAREDQQRADAAIKSASQQLARAQTRAQAASAGRRLASARTRYEQAKSAEQEAEAKATVSEDNEKHWSTQVGTAQGQIQEKELIAEKDVKRLQDWVTQIRNAKPGRKVVENREESPRWEYQDQEYDFFQRLGVINDLYYGRPARWLDMSAQDRAKLSQAYGLSEADLSDALTNDRNRADAHTFVWSYWAVIAIAGVIPLLLLALKGLLPIDLKRYYSTHEQELAGNYEALKFSGSKMFSATYEGSGGMNGNRSGPLG